MKKLNILFLLVGVLASSQVLPEELKNVNMNKVKSVLDWGGMNRFSEQNQVLLESGENSVNTVFIGDSITEGWSDYFPEFFQENPFINRGIGGQTTPQILVRFRQDVIEHQPKVVVILAGTNDIAGNTPFIDLATVAGNIFSMAEIAKCNGIKVIICSVLPAAIYPWAPGKHPDVLIPVLNQLLKDYAKQNQVEYLDYFSAMTNGKNGMQKQFTNDGVHVTKEGYQIMINMVKKVISEISN
jgi:lysophospholipase L1-like esterase|tara:strand:+ start:1653 stop:2375 length:723 start_codon:yes stop_codon:yes gene_type:complete